MIWPPIHFSYRTINRQLPTPAPSPPTWMLSKAQCDAACASASAKPSPHGGCRAIEWNWLGTDDQGRDVLARLHLRLPPLAAVRPDAGRRLLGDRHRRRRRFRAISAAGPISSCSASSRSGRRCRIFTCSSSSPRSSRRASSCCSAFLLLVLLGLSGPCGARRMPAHAQFRICQRGARAGAWRSPRSSAKHVLPNATVATLTFLPFVLNGSITTLTALDFLGFGLPPGSPSLGELLLQGKSNLAGALARPHRLRRHRADAVAARLHRRGRARRLRPEEDAAIGAW